MGCPGPKGLAQAMGSFLHSPQERAHRPHWLGTLERAGTGTVLASMNYASLVRPWAWLWAPGQQRAREERDTYLP